MLRLHVYILIFIDSTQVFGIVSVLCYGCGLIPVFPDVFLAMNIKCKKGGPKFAVDY